MADWAVPETELVFSAIRSQGAGGQNVNKVATAIHLRFDIRQSSLPEQIKDKLLACQDRRITEDGVIVIKAQSFRTQLQNKEDAIRRLQELIAEVGRPVKPRRSTRPSQSARRKRVEQKVRQGRIKALRTKPATHD
ncbi:MAG: alternative ribosome rescue aminoacyl-tRNA hydrolase ArfB [Pseudomonadales bacterium]|nr:alternative ribosome rescue aminoacyl-tRNA hydrolase ArfB [Pseudomonadales bacterium]